MVKEDRLPHALLFCGPHGAGKMALAMAFACYLLAGDETNGESSPSVSNARAMLRNWEHPDLHFSYPTIKLPSMSSEHQPVSTDLRRNGTDSSCKGLTSTMNQWMSQMGLPHSRLSSTGAET